MSSSIFRLTLTRIIPLGLLTGASMETFMYYTGFWSVATRKAEEREIEAHDALTATRNHTRDTPSRTTKETS